MTSWFPDPGFYALQGNKVFYAHHDPGDPERRVFVGWALNCARYTSPAEAAAARATIPPDWGQKQQWTIVHIARPGKEWIVTPVDDPHRGSGGGSL